MHTIIYIYLIFYLLFNFQANQLSNVLIWESEDLGPIGTRFQHQTVDQDHHNGNTMLLSTTYVSFQTAPNRFQNTTSTNDIPIHIPYQKKANKNIENLPT